MCRLTAIVAVMSLAVVTRPAIACTICGESIRNRQTLRMHYTQAKLVLHGAIKNPRFDPKTDEGFTDLHLIAAIKDDPARAGQTVLLLRAYVPVIGDTPPGYLAFFGVANGKPDLTFGVPATPAVVQYVQGMAKLDANDTDARLAYCFKHLASTDPVVAADAFVEFARASDAEIVKAAKHYSPAELRKLITDEKIPAERLGVFAFLLGVCGGPADAAFLVELLTRSPQSDRVIDAYGGLLAGYVLLSPKEGWALAQRVLADEKQPYAVRLSTVGTVRFFQAYRGDAFKLEILKCCAALLPHADLADQAIEDLRRWGWWDLSADVFAQFGKPSHSAPIVRRCIVRYALSCPNEDARRFVMAVRQADPKLVATVEEQVKMFEPVPKK